MGRFELDSSARAGLLLASYLAGASQQPGLLTRGTTDQAIISGVSAATGYGWGVSSHSLLSSIAARIGRGGPGSGILVDTLAAGAGLAAAAALPTESGHRPGTSLARLGASAVAATGVAGLGSRMLGWTRGRRGGSAINAAAMAAVGVGAWWRVRPARTRIGSQQDDGEFLEDTPRQISPGEAAGLAVVTGAALFGLSHAESALTDAISKGAARVIGGTPQDHRTIGRLGATGISFGVGWLGLTLATAKLNGSGSQVEPANTAAPTLPEVTGSPASGIPWDVQSREGTRWLSEVLLADHITDVMGEPARQPIRVYASLDAAATEEERAELLFAELERTDAFSRSAIAIFSPTGSGYVNYVASETFEYLTRGDCASMAIEYSVLPSALSLTRAEMGTRQTQLVVDRITERLLAMPADQRPRFFMFGESLGSKVSEELFLGHSDVGPRSRGLDAGVWVGTPAFTKWRSALWADRSQAEPPGIGPGATYLPRAVSDWHALSQAERDKVRYLLLQNGDDPVPKFEAPLLWRRPDWLGPDSTRPPGAPHGTDWLPVTTFITTFIDLMNALTPTPGVFQEGGHDYRVEIPEAIRAVWRLQASDEQMVRVNEALRARELGWELKRDWDSAALKAGRKGEKARAKVEREAADWTGAADPLTEEEIAGIIARDTEPEQ